MAVAALATAVAAVAVTQAVLANPQPSSLMPERNFVGLSFEWPFDRYSPLWIGGAFIVGVMLGVVLARGWWRTLAIDALGLAIAVVLMLAGLSTSGGPVYGWLFWVFGVSAGVGLGNLIHHRRLVRTSLIRQPG
jgi:hypothetical protein